MDNDDSSVPNRYGQMMSEFIRDTLKRKGFMLQDLSVYVNLNKDLETGNSKGLNVDVKDSLLERILGKLTFLRIGYNS